MTRVLPRRPALSALWVAVVILGIVFRIGIMAVADNHLRAPWSGGGDAPVYVLLAQNLLHGDGFTYARQPTAMRPPGYAFLLAALMWVFGANFILAIRCLQLLLGLTTAYFCSRTSALLLGEKTALPTLAVALVFPTLVFITGELLTEAIGAFLATAFLYLAVQTIQKPRMILFAALGAVTSGAALFRFNMAMLGFVAIWIAATVKNSRRVWQRLLVLCASAGLVVAPWIVRNLVVFHGQAIYSTVSGVDAVTGIVAPQGRALPGDGQRIKAAEGWELGEIETNAPSRLNFPSEPVLNQQAWRAARTLWRNFGWRLLPTEAAKCSFFWLSTDQVFWTQSFSLHQRIVRWSGVVAYWIFLVLGVTGWFFVRRINPAAAHCFLVYAVIVTLLHLPFPMVTRYRIPLVDPILAILAGAALQARIMAAGSNRIVPSRQSS